MKINLKTCQVGDLWYAMLDKMHCGAGLTCDEACHELSKLVRKEWELQGKPEAGNLYLYLESERLKNEQRKETWAKYRSYCILPDDTGVNFGS